jgi:uncharacterized glyoxalase superfamily protein PhnB
MPEGFHTVTPYLMLDNASKEIEFMKKAFGAEELSRLARPDGGVAHAQVKIGDSILMISDTTKEHPAQPCMMYIYVRDVDAAFERAIKAGGTSVQKPMDMFYGDRSGGLKDPSGMHWWLGTHKEDVPKAELEKRAAAMAKQGKGA